MEMIHYILTIAKTPGVVFALLWSAAILLGLFLNQGKNITSKNKELLVKHSEETASIILQFSFIYLSAILLGTMANYIVRWVILVFIILAMMFFLVRMAAASEYGYRKLPKEDRKLFFSILLMDLFIVIQLGFGLYWMIKTFSNFKM